MPSGATQPKGQWPRLMNKLASPPDGSWCYKFDCQIHRWWKFAPRKRPWIRQGAPILILPWWILDSLSGAVTNSLPI